MKRIFFIIILMFIAIGVNARQPSKGYRGFIEWSNDFHKYPDLDGGSGKALSGFNFYSGATTSHGYQINQDFFVGAGIGAQCNENYLWIVPVFVEGRMDFKSGRFTPFLDFRLGANVAKDGGVYISPSVGYRFNWGRKVGINIGVGLTAIGGKEPKCYSEYNPATGTASVTYKGYKNTLTSHFAFRFGFDF